MRTEEASTAHSVALWIGVGLGTLLTGFLIARAINPTPLPLPPAPPPPNTNPAPKNVLVATGPYGVVPSTAAA